MSWREHAPEPARLWIRWSPRRWPAAAEVALDLAERRLVWPAAAPDGGREIATLPPPPRPDLVYLPPVPNGLEGERDALAGALAAAGMPVLAQATSASSLPEAGAGIVALDLTAALLAPAGSGLERLRAQPARPRAGGELWVVLPLLPGVTPALPQLEPWLDAVAALAPGALLLPTPELTPVDRRRLADAAGEERYEAIFHGAAPVERAVARAAARRGLALFPRRPKSAAAPPRGARNRELAAALAEAGELWLRLGRSEPEGQALLAAARHLDSTALDVAALAREGNLGVVDWLSADARRLVAECAASGTSPGVARLRAAWLAEEGSGPP